MQIVLYRPQIPQNTGNIARSCAVTGTSLRLIPPMAFALDEKEIKRAGLDYWSLLDLELIEDQAAWIEAHHTKCVFFSSHATQFYSDYSFTEDSLLVFGSESHGLPPEWHQRWPNQFVRLPMREIEQARCLNLATSVGIALYEALRQSGFQGLK